MRLLACSTVGVAAALLAGCGGGGPAGTPGGGQPLGAAASPDALVQRAGGLEGITVVGAGSAEAAPDVAGWSFGVQTQAETAADALSEASTTAERLLAALRDAGIAKEDLRTEQVSLHPRTRDGHEIYEGEGGAGPIVGYTASTTVQATVRDVARAGAIVDAAVTAGANTVWGPELRSEDNRSRYQAALEAAYDDARARAEAIAAKAGVALGAPLAIVEGGGGHEYYAEAADETSGVPIEAGRHSVTATVTVTFALG